MLPTTWMNLNVDFLPRLPNTLIPAFETLNKEAIWSCKFWPTELGNNKWVFFQAVKFVVICYAAVEN